MTIDLTERPAKPIGLASLLLSVVGIFLLPTVSAGVAAANGSRRSVCDSVTRSLPEASASTAPASVQISMPPR